MTIRHSRGTYDVRFASFDEVLDQLPARSLVVSDSNVLTSWRPRGLPVLEVPPGEPEKNLANFGALLEAFASQGATRSTTIVALGGGVVGDLAGFAAAAYMRGVPVIQVPTTLLAMVDASVGGKVGVDLKAGKNLAGAFHPPQAVWIALETLRTLSERQFVNGTAEVWKTGCILDAALFGSLEAQALHLEDERLEQVVGRCVELKAQVVAEDEFETSGARAILNFGHTVGHALEVVSGYGELLHGEAVAIGMVAEAVLGERLGHTESGVASRLRRALELQGLPVATPWLREEDALLDAMRRDKKSTEGELAFSLVPRLGECKLVRGVDPREVRAALRSL
ncbi:MAG: 3-dehydroquinate synthase [Chthonomonadaceae bacterium]|nr:3-dehydroquinate synthase [Chthonomonadaceae bacterium]